MMTGKKEVSILFCSQCGFKLNALTLKKDLETAFHGRLKVSAVGQQPAGVFQVLYKDDIIYSRLNEHDGTVRDWPANGSVVQEVAKKSGLSVPFFWRSVEAPNLIHWPTIALWLCVAILLCQYFGYLSGYTTLGVFVCMFAWLVFSETATRG
jgi:selT/selW/selH-like putative selenoprotein